MMFNKLDTLFAHEAWLVTRNPWPFQKTFEPQVFTAKIAQMRS